MASRDDAKSRPFRAQRAREMMAACPIDEAGVVTSGGEDTMTAFFEARLAYVNGLYLCTVPSRQETLPAASSWRSAQTPPPPASTASSPNPMQQPTTPPNIISRSWGAA